MDFKPDPAATHSELRRNNVPPLLRLQQIAGNHAVHRSIDHRRSLLRQAVADETGPVGGTPATASNAGPEQSCGQPHAEAIEKALGEARSWRSRVNAWFDVHIRRILRQATLGRGPLRRIGQAIFDDLRFLHKHFRIGDIIWDKGTSFPIAADDVYEVRDFENFGNASYHIRKGFRDVELDALSYTCQTDCPKGRSGAETLGSAAPGSRKFTIFTSCFDKQGDHTKTGVVLHEAFHASFSEFDHDIYSFKENYPGRSATTNADSYSTFGSIVATGRSYRVIELPPINVTPATP